MVTMISTHMTASSGGDDDSLETVTNEKTEYIENTIECLQCEIDRLKHSMLTDEERIITMNRQLHVLSANYIDFNAKVNKQLLRRHNENINKQDLKEVIDKHTVTYMVETGLNSKIHEEIIEHDGRNLISLRKKLKNRFAQQYDPYEYSRYVKIKINGTKINNLDKFSHEFTKHLNYILARD